MPLWWGKGVLFSGGTWCLGDGSGGCLPYLSPLSLGAPSFWLGGEGRSWVCESLALLPCSLQLPAPLCYSYYGALTQYEGLRSKISGHRGPLPFTLLHVQIHPCSGVAIGGLLGHVCELNRNLCWITDVWLVNWRWDKKRIFSVHHDVDISVLILVIWVFFFSWSI